MTTMWRDERSKKKSRRRSTSCGLPKKLKKDFHRRILIDYYLADLKIMLSLQVLSIREDFMLFDRFFFHLARSASMNMRIK